MKLTRIHACSVCGHNAEFYGVFSIYEWTSDGLACPLLL